MATEFGVQNREDYLDAAVKVAGHEIGAAEENEWIPPVSEDIDAAMFEETVYDASNLDVFAQSGDTGPEAADPADEQLDGDSFLRAGVERLDDLWVHEGIGFDKDSGRSTGTVVGRFPVDEFEEAGGKIKGGNEEFVEVGGFRHSRENVKKGSDFGSQGGATGEQAEVGVKAGSTGMIVSRAEVQIGLEMVLFPTDDEEDFAVGF
jgi:hypothetical protein